MTRLTWNAPNKRFFETGCDRGVFYPKAGPAVAWNGLTSVEENGADSAVEYYIDGRPFLFFPKVKEYSATLKAYTYPDEFAACMGLIKVEDADGFYLDSQQGDSFDLSYRTLVGNGTNAVDHGYKIHLIYNAVVAPQGVSYSSLGSNVNPNEFTWEIRAVPVAVDGYRPSAHFIIDTRHMDPEIVAKIEQLLYGDDVTAASLPDPVDVVELLTYGGVIVIVDNGDGTWTAKGSRHDIYLLDNDTFQIDNVENTDYGDGTFGISTTQT